MGTAIADTEDEQTAGSQFIQAPELQEQKDQSQIHGQVGVHIKTIDQYEIRIDEMARQVKVRTCYITELDSRFHMEEENKTKLSSYICVPCIHARAHTHTPHRKLTPKVVLLHLCTGTPCIHTHTPYTCTHNNNKIKC